ncbi:chloride channel protein [Actinospica durhamensis]|uniref:Chloride channel protein n=1 Tax=Actinospica durhamensis TaxID=1508375 RepID=A0A941ES79_9ACTN|nr:chloride channel protein [Actinospica durhamensis]MBR7832879.1 chloride channel protein [Actinospica durhamensis]
MNPGNPKKPEAPGDAPPPADPLAPLRTRAYAVLLILTAVLGVPLAAGAFGFLQLTGHLQHWLYSSLPVALGFHTAPVWWPLPVLALAGIVVGACIRYLPGTSGHEPAEGFKMTGAPGGAELPGIAVAAIVSIGFGAVIGPEAPLVALGGGAAALVIRLLKPAADARTVSVVGAAGSFAAISTLLGSPLTGAFLLMEASGLSGATLEIALLPGLVASGIGALIFVGLGSWTGLGAVSLTIAHPPHASSPTAAEFGWALVLGVGCALFGFALRRCALTLRRPVPRARLWLTPVAGLAVAGLAIAYAEGTGHAASDVLFSGQSGLSPLIANSAGYSVGALVLLLACKGLAYSVSMAAFRGGPVFPSLFLGGAAGLMLSHAAGLSEAAGVAMGIGAMSVAMLGLPMTSVLLAALLLGGAGLTSLPLVIVAVVVSHVLSVRLAAPHPAPAAPAPTPVRSGAP